MKFSFLAWLAVLGGWALAPSSSPGAPLLPGRWSVTGSIAVPGDGGWDYAAVDRVNHRLFVAHGDQEAVIDLRKRAVIGCLPGNGLHGVALAPELERGFLSNGRSGSITLFNLTTLMTIGTVPAEPDADAICYDPVTKRVFSLNGDSQSATVIDAVQGTQVGGIALGGKPEFARVDRRGSLFVNLENKDQVLKIDTASLKVVAQFPLPPGSSPSSMGIDRANGKLFIGCRNQTLLVVDAGSGKIDASLPLGAGVDATLYDAVHHRVYASCRDGTLTVVAQNSPGNYVVEQVVATEPGARTLAYDSSTDTLYLPVAKLGPAPQATPQNPQPRPAILPGTFHILVLNEKAASGG